METQSNNPAPKSTRNFNFIERDKRYEERSAIIAKMTLAEVFDAFVGKAKHNTSTEALFTGNPSVELQEEEPFTESERAEARLAKHIESFFAKPEDQLNGA